MKDTYDTERPDAVAQYKRECQQAERVRVRNGIVAMAAFAPLWSAADPKSRLAYFNRIAPFVLIGTVVAFAGIVALGLV
ncbi:hypothetical protein [Ruegeria profundi]|uniref:hypothetical protein n=1 Tax=Ruegeria profundi TaxID=1685378 RepID=UPI001CD755F0|nr:hypothetical protein [Ruegeria profundi]MCA0929361.1 hypothetical protein [Ruegeria profundi]